MSPGQGRAGDETLARILSSLGTEGSSRRFGGGVGSADIGEGRHAEAHCCVASGNEAVELGEFGVRRGQADLESFRLTAPALAFGFGDASDEIVADVNESCPLSRVWSKKSSHLVSLR